MTTLFFLPKRRAQMLCLIFMLSILALNTPLAQATSTPPVSWRCWPADSNIECLLATAVLVDAASIAPDPTSSIDLPGAVMALRTDPEAFRGELIVIPMHTPPVDMQFAAELAAASMCGSRVDCTVDFTSMPPDIDEIGDLTY